MEEEGPERQRKLGRSYSEQRQSDEERDEEADGCADQTNAKSEQPC
jgi:hypothetical protein